MPDQDNTPDSPVPKLPQPRQLTPMGGIPNPLSPQTFPTLSAIHSPGQAELPSNPNIYPDGPDTRSSVNLILLSILFLLFFLILGASLVAYAIAYNYIDVNNPEISGPVTNFVRSLPFTP